MANADLALVAGIGAVAIAFVLWLWTNVHILRVGRAIKADIDVKRAATEAFVDSRIERVERVVADLRGEVAKSVVLPPAVLELPESMEELRGELNELVRTIGKDVASLPHAVRLELMAEAGRASQEVMQAAREKGEELKTELRALNSSIGPQVEDMRARIVRAITREPSAKERKDMGSVGELIWNLGRMKAAEWLETSGPTGAGIPLLRSGRGNSGNSDF